MHNNLTYGRSNTIVEKNEYHKIDFSLKYNQVNIIKYIINNSENINIANIKEKYLKYTKESLKINNKEITKIKFQIIGNLKNISLLECIGKINNNEINIDIFNFDTKYDIKIKNKTDIKEKIEKIILFNLKNRLSLMGNLNEFFLDATFDIIPSIYKPYKLISLAGYNNIENRVYIIGFISIKYFDYISFTRTFKYLKDNFNFNPIVIHTDFEKSLGIAIKKANFFNKEIINIKSFFFIS